MGGYSDNLMSRLNTRGPAVGACNICGAWGPLTEDHVPPKGVPGTRGYDLHALQQAIGSQPVGRSRQFQNGVTFRSLCDTCNTKRLGGIYDPALVDLARRVLSLLESRIALPSSIGVLLKPNLVLRSVVGHILAIEPERPAAGTMEESMKRYFLDPAAQLPRDLHIGVWLYPSSRRIQVRGAGRVSMRPGGEMFVFSVLKFFPVAFIVTNERDIRAPSSLVWLDGARSVGPAEELEIVFPLRMPHSIGWPEHPEDDDMSAVMHGSGATVAMPRKAQPKILRRP